MVLRFCYCGSLLHVPEFDNQSGTAAYFEPYFVFLFGSWFGHLNLALAARVIELKIFSMTLFNLFLVFGPDDFTGFNGIVQSSRVDLGYFFPSFMSIIISIFYGNVVSTLLISCELSLGVKDKV